MKVPSPYPRVPHILPGRGGRDDLVLSAAEVRNLLAAEVLVEEKLDGSNVVIWLADDGEVTVALRSGPGAVDRAGQLGPLRAWAAGHDDALRGLLQGRRAVYGEWLMLAHSVTYDRLPDYLVVLDLWDEAEGFLPVATRDLDCAAAGIQVPPALWRGVAGARERLEALISTSIWGGAEMEGLVVRRLDGMPPRVAKLVRTGWTTISDVDWAKGRPRNGLAKGVSGWR